MKKRYRSSTWKQLFALSTINPKKLAFSFPIPHSSFSTSIRSVENEASVIWKSTNNLYFHYILIERVLYNTVTSVYINEINANWTRGNLNLLIWVFAWDFGYVILGYVILYPLSFLFFYSSIVSVACFFV